MTFTPRAIWILTAALVPAAAAAQTGERLTVDAAVAMAMAYNRGVMNAALQGDQAENGRARTRARGDCRSSRSTRRCRSCCVRSMSNFAQGAFGSYPGIGPIPGTDTAITSRRSRR
jgi:hypothetical protein